MNSYERYVGVLNREPVDFLPRIPILMQYAAEHIGSNYAEFEIGRAHVWTPVTLIYLVCRLLLEKKKKSLIFLSPFFYS